MNQLIRTFVLSITLVYAGLSQASDILDNSHFGFLAVDSETFEVIAEHQSDKLFIPASATKMISTSAALNVLGPDHRFCTEIRTSGSICDGLLYGNIKLVGSGDPTLTYNDLNELAKRIHALGISSIVGSVFVDDALFEGNTLRPQIEWEDISQYYAPEISSLSIDGNLINFEISLNNTSNAIEIKPKNGLNYLKVVNNIVLGEVNNISVERHLTDNVVVLTGTLNHNNTAPIVIKIPVHNPSEYAKFLFQNALKNNGIVFRDLFFPGTTFSNQLAKHESEPLSEIIKLANKPSDNHVTELLFRSVGSKIYPELPSYEAALTAIEDYFAIFDPTKSFAIYDGTGLSRHNLISPRQIVNLLIAEKDNLPFLNSLSQARKDGTLKDRLPDLQTQLIGKTGSLSGVSTLGGYATTQSGKNVIFAIFVNNSVHTNKEINKAIDDRIMSILQDCKVEYRNNFKND